MTLSMLALGWIDTVFIAVLLMSAAVGVWRGVVYEVLSLLGWLVAWVCAQFWGADVANAWLPSTWPAGIARTAGYAMLFIATLIVWRLLVWLVQQLVHASPVAPVDRALGGAFGFLRGMVIVAVAVMLVGFTPLSAQAAWQASSSVQWARWGLTLVAPLLPGGGWFETPASPSGLVPLVGPASGGTERLSRPVSAYG